MRFPRGLTPRASLRKAYAARLNANLSRIPWWYPFAILFLAAHEL